MFPGNSMTMTFNKRACGTRAVQPVEQLEGRLFLAAHIIGSATSYPTIQSAVNAAAPGATVVVDAGTYPELVTVSKSLTLRGARAGVDGQSFLRGLTKGETIVSGADFGAGSHSTTFYITADDVTIDGFTAQEDTSSSTYGAGIVIAPRVSGTHIYNNVIKDNVAGLYLANFNAADPAIIRHNVFAFNNTPGNNSGRGIYTDGGVSGGNLTNVVIDQNLFIRNFGDGSSDPEAAVGLEAQGPGQQFNIAITNNLMIGNGKGVLLYNASNITIKGNIITGCTDANSGAIRIEGNVNGLAIQRNTIFNNAGAAVSIVDFFTGPSSNISVNYNNFLGNVGGGLFLGALSYSGTLDAANNWWGSFSGPGGDGGGSGQALVRNGNSVLFAPFSRFPIL